jgi:hypothetical protein
MRRVPIGARKAAGSAAHNVAKEKLRAVNPKFHPGPNPLEREPFESTIKPQYKEQLEQMMKMMADYADKNPQAAQAVNLWRTQVAQGTFSDQVKFDFARRFFYWLLGRGTEDDVKRTFWGRGNAAVYNGEVREYIETFTKKRMEYAQQLALLSNRIPETLNGYYLYFKVGLLIFFFFFFFCSRRAQYIVGGGLQRKSGPEGSWWDMSDEDYLSDFEMFRNEFDKDKTQHLSDPFDSTGPANHQVGEAPYPRTQKDMANYAYKGMRPRAELSQDKVVQKLVDATIQLDRSRGAKPDEMQELLEEVDSVGMQSISGGISAIGGGHQNGGRTADFAEFTPEHVERMHRIKTRLGKEKSESMSSGSSISSLQETPSPAQKLAVLEAEREAKIAAEPTDPEMPALEQADEKAVEEAEAKMSRLIEDESIREAEEEMQKSIVAAGGPHPDKVKNKPEGDEPILTTREAWNAELDLAEELLRSDDPEDKKEGQQILLGALHALHIRKRVDLEAKHTVAQSAPRTPKGVEKSESEGETPGVTFASHLQREPLKPSRPPPKMTPKATSPATPFTPTKPGAPPGKETPELVEFALGSVRKKLEMIAENELLPREKRRFASDTIRELDKRTAALEKLRRIADVAKNSTNPVLKARAQETIMNLQEKALERDLLQPESPYVPGSKPTAAAAEPAPEEVARQRAIEEEIAKRNADEAAARRIEAEKAAKNVLAGLPQPPEAVLEPSPVPKPPLSKLDQLEAQLAQMRADRLRREQARMLNIEPSTPSINVSDTSYRRRLAEEGMLGESFVVSDTSEDIATPVRPEGKRAVKKVTRFDPALESSTATEGESVGAMAQEDIEDLQAAAEEASQNISNLIDDEINQTLTDMALQESVPSQISMTEESSGPLPESLSSSEQSVELSPLKAPGKKKRVISSPPK